MENADRIVVVSLAQGKEVAGRVVGSGEHGTLFVASEAEYQRASLANEEPRTLGFAPEYVREA